MLLREKWSARMIRSSLFWASTAVVSGIAFVVIVFLYYVAAPWNCLGKIDPIGGEAGYEQVGQVERRWRGVLTDTYVIEKLTGWTPELSPPKDSPLFQWKVLAGECERRTLA